MPADMELRVKIIPEFSDFGQAGNMFNSGGGGNSGSGSNEFGTIFKDIRNILTQQGDQTRQVISPALRLLSAVLGPILSAGGLVYLLTGGLAAALGTVFGKGLSDLYSKFQNWQFENGPKTEANTITDPALNPLGLGAPASKQGSTIISSVQKSAIDDLKDVYLDAGGSVERFNEIMSDNLLTMQEETEILEVVSSLKASEAITVVDLIALIRDETGVRRENAAAISAQASAQRELNAAVQTAGKKGARSVSDQTALDLLGEGRRLDPRGGLMSAPSRDITNSPLEAYRRSQQRPGTDITRRPGGHLPMTKPGSNITLRTDAEVVERGMAGKYGLETQDRMKGFFENFER